MFILLIPNFVQNVTKISLAVLKWQPLKIFDAKFHENRLIYKNIARGIKVSPFHVDCNDTLLVKIG